MKKQKEPTRQQGRPPESDSFRKPKGNDTSRSNIYDDQEDDDDDPSKSYGGNNKTHSKQGQGQAQSVDSQRQQKKDSSYQQQDYPGNHPRQTTYQQRDREPNQSQLKENYYGSDDDDSQASVSSPRNQHYPNRNQSRVQASSTKRAEMDDNETPIGNEEVTKDEKSQSLSKARINIPNYINELNENIPLVDSDEEEKGLFVPFESYLDRPNEGRLLKIKNAGLELEEDEERTLRIAIKDYWRVQKKISSISDIKVILDVNYPTVCLQYCLNGKEVQLNKLVDFMKAAWKHDHKTLCVFQKLYNSNYEQLTQQECKILEGVAAFRASLLQKRFAAKGVKSTVSVMACIPNRTVQFCFIDMWLTEISFNNIFIERYQSRFPQAYQLAQKKISSIPLTDKMGKESQHAVLGDEQKSSDDELPTVQPSKCIKTEERELKQLFFQDLTSFEDKIDEKNSLLDEIIDDYRKKLEAEKLSEEVSELDTTLNDYRKAIVNFRHEYDGIKESTKSEVSKNWKIHMIYKQMRILRNQLGSELPIISRKRALFTKLDKENLIILEGETGSGKSTQLPQMLCEYYKIFSDAKAKPIVLTQPRKLSTRTLAQRIAFEMDEKLHGFVDYVSSSSKNSLPNPDCKILVKLDRLLLDEIEEDPLLQKYSCLIIDEAHERTISIDVIIGLIKNILTKRTNFKVIITSATLDSALFEKYFGTKTFQVSGRLYPVTIKHLPFKSKESYAEKIYECINTEIIPNGHIKNEYRGHILAFCSSVDEINMLCERFRTKLDQKQFVICPLHGKLEPTEQKKAFENVGSKYKLVFSSRIAETAITIDRVKVVIDIGYDREMVYDQNKRISSFEMMQISQSAAKQRAGRAGRTTAGYCFRLYEQQEQKKMRLNKRPEIDATPLDIVVLRLKQLQIQKIEDFPYLSPPAAQNLRQSLEAMQLIGCLDENEQINEIGRTLVRIPIQPLLSRAIVDGLIYEHVDKSCRITERIIRILAMVVNPNVFYSNEENQEQVNKIKFKDFADEDGDFFSLLNIYEDFEKQREQQAHSFCRERFLNKKTLIQARELVKEIKGIISGINLNFQRLRNYFPEVRRKLDIFRTDKELITSCLLSSFCQNVCLYSGDNSIGYTHVRTETPIQIYGTSFLSLQGLAPKWIICYDIIKTSKTYCKIAQRINLKILQLSVQPQLFKRYKLGQCENYNPFYEIIEKSVPTIVLKVFQQIKINKDYILRNNMSVEGLFKNCECVINPATHELKIYFVRSKETDTLRDDLEQIITNHEENFSNRYYYSFVGMNLAELWSGCEVAHFNLYSDLFKVELRGMQQNLIKYIIEMYEKHCHSIVSSDQQMTISFTKAEERAQFAVWFNSLLLDYSVRSRIKVEVIDESKDKMKKIAKGILKIRFWAAQRRRINRDKFDWKDQNNRGFRYIILYPNPFHALDRYQSGHEQSKAQNKYTKDLSYTMQQLNQLYSEEGMYFSMAKNGLSLIVDVEDPTFVEDECDLEEKLYKAHAKDSKILSHLRTICYRQVDSDLSQRPLTFWKREVQRLLPWASSQSITLRGYNNDRKNKQSSYNEMFTDLWAEVHAFDTRDAETFIARYSGKRNVLGSEKIHASIVYKQNITRMKASIFKVFKKRYEDIKDEVFAKDPRIEITETEWTSKDGVRFVYLDCSGPKRDSLLEPIQKLRKFVRKTIQKIDPTLARVLNSFDGKKKRVYCSLFDDIELYFDDRIYLDFNNRHSEIEIYCRDEIQQRQVIEYIREELSQLNRVDAKISYRGKNIYKVKQVLEDHRNRISYSISFSERCVYVNGEYEDIEECTNEINWIVNEHKAECDICYNLLSAPVKLFDCGHEFCSKCLLDNIRSMNDDPRSFPLQCPSYERCGKYINVNDLRELLDEDEFNQTCDTGISRLIDNKRYHGCLTPFCKQIFEIERTNNDKGAFSCGVCNLSYCKKCRGSAHPNETCEEARRGQGKRNEPPSRMGKVEAKKTEYRETRYQEPKRQQYQQPKRQEPKYQEPKQQLPKYKQPKDHRQTKQQEPKGYRQTRYQEPKEYRQPNKQKTKRCGTCDRDLYENMNSCKVICKCRAGFCWICSKTFKDDEAVSQHVRAKHKPARR